MLLFGDFDATLYSGERGLMLMQDQTYDGGSFSNLHVPRTTDHGRRTEVISEILDLHFRPNDRSLPRGIA
jgi:hypothetical protein